MDRRTGETQNFYLLNNSIHFNVIQRLSVKCLKLQCRDSRVTAVSYEWVQHSLNARAV